jgi:hypothetical protein
MRQQAWTNGIPDPVAAYAVVDVYMLCVISRLLIVLEPLRSQELQLTDI